MTSGLHVHCFQTVIALNWSQLRCKFTVFNNNLSEVIVYAILFIHLRTQQLTLCALRVALDLTESSLLHK